MLKGPGNPAHQSADWERRALLHHASKTLALPGGAADVFARMVAWDEEHRFVLVSPMPVQILHGHGGVDRRGAARALLPRLMFVAAL